jgi:PAS domain S-box-containing protein
MVEREHLGDAAGAPLAILNSSPLAIVALDRDGLVTMWNPAAERLLGWTASETLARPLRCIPADDMPGFTQAFASVLEGASLESIEVERVRKDGRRVDLSISLAPLRDEHGRIRGAVSVMSDISARKAAERQRDSAGRIAELALSRGRMVAGRLEVG